MRKLLLIFAILALCWAIGFAGNHQKINNIHIANAIAGDVNSSGELSGTDVIYLLKYIKGLNPAPRSLFEGDANGDCRIDLRDVSYLIDYFKGRVPEPHSGNCR